MCNNEIAAVTLATPVNQIAKQYCGAQRGQLPPHVFAVADKAYQVLLREQADQVSVFGLCLGAHTGRQAGRQDEGFSLWGALLA